MKTILITISFLICLISLKAQVTDKDGNSYKTVQIGSQLWMSENLNVTHFRNGDSIPEMEDASAWAQAGNDGKPAWCYYNSDPVNGMTYHKLYNWYAVNDPRGLAPQGWHIPSILEWNNLANYLDGAIIAGSKMKATGGWDNNGNGTNESGFTGLPGGYRYFNGPFYYVGTNVNWWSSSESSTNEAWYRYLFNNLGYLFSASYFKGNGISCRCIRD